MVSRFRKVILSVLCALVLGALALVAAAPATPAAAEEAASGLGLVYLESAEVAPGDVESIAVLAEEGAPELAGATLTVAKADGTAERTLDAVKVADGAALLELANDDASLEGEWRVATVTLRWADGSESAIPMDEVEPPTFTFASEPVEATDTTFASVDEDGAVVTADDLDAVAPGDAAAALAVTGYPSHALNTFDNAVVALDPGHGAEDSGATGIGFLEKDANWKISMATKRYLEGLGIRVFVTHGQNESPNPSIYDRVQRAMAAGACVFVSQHNNETPSGRGAEIYVPYDSSFYRNVHEAGTALANELAPRLERLGLRYRGTKVRLFGGGSNYANGDEADYYGIIRYARQQGVTGILVEHAFVDNPDDAALLRDDAFLERLGRADGEAIYAQLENLYRVYCANHGRTYVSPEQEVRAAEASIDAAPDNGVLRLYNRWSGEHLFTTDVGEAKDLVHTSWRYEGTGWTNPTEGTDVYRLYNPYTDEHLFTTSPAEYDVLATRGWRKEGVKLHSLGATATGAVPIYRLYNRFADCHLFTTDVNEYEANRKLGWTGEGVQLYGIGAGTASVPGTSSTPGTPSVNGSAIMGQSRTSLDALKNWFANSMASYGKAYPALYAQKGAPTARDFVQILWEEATTEGVRPDVLLSQVILETGWLQFGGMVTAADCNFGGIGALDNSGGRYVATFGDVRTGLRAQVQHLRAYADPTVTRGNLANPCVDPRFDLVTPKGKAPAVEGLSGTWASSGDYGSNILGIIRQFPNDLG